MSTVKDTEIARLKAELPDWSHEDVAWLSSVPEKLQQVARRYGRNCFSMTMQAGAINHAIQICFASRPPKQVHDALVVVSHSYNNCFLLALKGAGVEEKLFVSCKEDVERIATLGDDGQGGARSKGGIILPS